MIRTAGSLLVAAALLVGLVGCQSNTAPDVGVVAPSEDIDAGPPPAPEEDDKDDDSQDSIDLTPEGCLSNRWLLNNETWRSMLQPVANEAGATIESVTGEFVLDLQIDGSYSATYTGWTVTQVQTGGKAVVERSGTDTGQWAISEYNVELYEDSAGSAVEGYVESGGQRTVLPSVGSADTGSFEVFEYECSPDDLLVTIETGTVFFTRMS